MGRQKNLMEWIYLILNLCLHRHSTELGEPMSQGNPNSFSSFQSSCWPHFQEGRDCWSLLQASRGHSWSRIKDLGGETLGGQSQPSSPEGWLVISEPCVLTWKTDDDWSFLPCLIEFCSWSSWTAEDPIFRLKLSSHWQEKKWLTDPSEIRSQGMWHLSSCTEKLLRTEKSGKG